VSDEAILQGSLDGPWIASLEQDAKSGHRLFASILLSLLDEIRIQISDGIT
jgi:hypothetical protein